MKKTKKGEKWKANKEDCDALRSAYPGAFTKPGDFVRKTKAAVEDVMLAAIIRTAADTLDGGTEFASYIRLDYRGVYYEKPTGGQIAVTAGGQKYFSFSLPGNHPLVANLAAAHSHEISYATYQKLTSPRVPPLIEYLQAINSSQFSEFDRDFVKIREIPMLMHNAKNELRILRPEFDENNLTGELFGDIDADIVNKLIECVRWGF